MACITTYEKQFGKINISNIRGGIYISFPDGRILKNALIKDCDKARQQYLNMYQDVKNTNVDPWNHYNTHGKNENRIWPTEACGSKDTRIKLNEGSPLMFIIYMDNEVYKSDEEGNIALFQNGNRNAALSYHNNVVKLRKFVPNDPGFSWYLYPVNDEMYSIRCGNNVDQQWLEYDNENDIVKVGGEKTSWIIRRNPDSKSTLKALSWLQEGKDERFHTLSTCVMPYETLNLFNSSTCESIDSKMRKTKTGEIDLDQNIALTQIKNGSGVYPMEGCSVYTEDRYPFKNAIDSYTKQFEQLGNQSLNTLRKTVIDLNKEIIDISNQKKNQDKELQQAINMYNGMIETCKYYKRLNTDYQKQHIPKMYNEMKNVWTNANASVDNIRKYITDMPNRINHCHKFGRKGFQIVSSHDNTRRWGLIGDRLTLTRHNDSRIVPINLTQWYDNRVFGYVPVSKSDDSPNYKKSHFALLVDGDRNKAIKHGGWVMWAHPFQENWDFGWFFIHAGGDYYHIHNFYNHGGQFPGGVFVGYDHGLNRVLIVPNFDSRRLVWRIELNNAAELGEKWVNRNKRFQSDQYLN